MALSDLKNHLAEKSEKELKQEILALYKNFKNVKEFYDHQFNPQDELEIFNQYKFIIKNQFFPNRGHGRAKLSIARKAVTDYKKIVGIHQNLVDIAMYYVEQGVEFTCAYGDIDEAFYNSMESMFSQALQWAKISSTLYIFQNRADQVCQKTSHMGWGFHDGLSETYDEFYPDAFI